MSQYLNNPRLVDAKGDFTSLRRLFASSQVNERNGDFSPVATCINENTSMTGLPNLHDGFFDGLWLSANKSVRLFVRTLAGERSTIVLTDVEALNINGLKAGNIIFDLVLIAPDKLSMEDITEVYDLKPHEAEMASKLLNKAQARVQHRCAQSSKVCFS